MVGSARTTRWFAFVARVVINVALVVVFRVALGGDHMDLPPALLFVAMLSLITLLYDRFLPVHAVHMTAVDPHRPDGQTDLPP